MKKILAVLLFGMTFGAYSTDRIHGTTYVRAASTTTMNSSGILTSGTITASSLQSTGTVSASALQVNGNSNISGTVTMNKGVAGTKSALGVPSLSNMYVGGTASDNITGVNKGILQVDSSSGVATIFGGLNSSPYTTYIQSIDDRTGQTGTFPLAINPDGGNVGIGTTAPSTKLDVNGTVSASALQINGTINATNLVVTGNPGFYVYTSSTAFSVPAAAITVVTFNTQAWANGTTPNISTGLYTVPSTGYYHIAGGFCYDGSVSVAGTIRTVYLYQNTTAIASDSAIPNATFLRTAMNVSVVQYLSAGDTVSLRTYQDSGAARTNYSPVGRECYLSVQKLF